MRDGFLFMPPLFFTDVGRSRRIASMSARILALFGLMLLVATPSFAQAPAADSLPAVSEINGKVSLEGGGTSGQGQSSAVGIAQASLTAPLGHRFGVQIDGLAATSYNSFVGSGDLHLFWRNPQIGLLGPVVAVGGGRGTTVGWYGAEGEIYASMFTVAAYGGYQDAGSSALLASGGFYFGRLTVYPVPDLALTVGGGAFAGAALGNGRIEYQPDFVARRNVSFFVDGNVGDNAFYRVTSGVRLYIGPEKTLIRRHREDDPIAWSQHRHNGFCGGHGPCLGGNGGNGGVGGTGGTGGTGN
jgi:hypothetical protein